MRVYGLTGGIGMGKSACADFLREQGVPVIDTDDLARELVLPGTPALAEITQVFGSRVVHSSGELRRDLLATIVFNDPAARRQLERILHPRISDAWAAGVERLQAEGRAKAVVVIPLLFETNAESRFNLVVCLACSAQTQFARLRQRGWSPEEIERRLAAQLPITAKMERSHRVLWSEGSLPTLHAQAERVFELA